MADGWCLRCVSDGASVYISCWFMFFSSINRIPLSNHTLTQAHTVGHPMLNPVSVFVFFPERFFNDYLFVLFVQ